MKKNERKCYSELQQKTKEITQLNVYMPFNKENHNRHADKPEGSTTDHTSKY